MKNVQEKILDYIRAKESATFGELETVMTEAGFEWRGELFLCSHYYPNVIYWKYWNEQAVSLFTELINAGGNSPRTLRQPFLFGKRQRDC